MSKIIWEWIGHYLNRMAFNEFVTIDFERGPMSRNIDICEVGRTDLAYFKVDTYHLRLIRSLFDNGLQLAVIVLTETSIFLETPKRVKTRPDQRSLLFLAMRLL